MGGRSPNNNHNPEGRTRIPIDWDLVDNYLSFGSSGVQIAAVLGVHPQTLYDRCLKERGKTYTEYSYEKLEKGNANLLGIQYQLALKGNCTMAIWLGKQRLGQSDKVETKSEIRQEVIQKRILVLPDNGNREPKVE